MIASRLSLEKEITEKITERLGDKRETRQIIRDAVEIYNVPERLFSDYMSLRKNVTEAEPFMLFILADMLLTDRQLTNFYTRREIDTFSKSKWHVEKLQFPLFYDMTRVTDEQYIGTVTVKELMLLKDAQLIKYNENAQRTMKHIVKGELEYYQIALNKDAVRAIMESYEGDIYIPNTITLNLPEEADFEYDEKRKKLIINSTEYFDILDGYHRYIAMGKLYSQNPDFNYEMELRIVQFTEDKAKRFIWQEDQKTKMRKIDSDSMDTAKLSNKIIDRLNSGSFVLVGKISRNKGIINAAYLSNIVDIVYLKDIKKSEELKAVKQISTRLRTLIEEFTDEYPEYLEEPWDKITTYMLCYEDKYGDMTYLFDDIKKVKEDGSIYHMPNLTKADVTRTHKLLGRGGY